MSGRIDFARINAAALARLPALCEQWLPAGKVTGHEFKVGNIRGDAGDSLAINLNTGVWCDFGNPDHAGSDPISLFAAINGLKMGDAAKRLGDFLGTREGNGAAGPTAPPAAAKPTERPKWQQVTPVPDHAPAPPDVLGIKIDDAWLDLPVAARWAYRTPDGALVGYTCRVNLPDGGKDVLPIVWATNGRNARWQRQAFGKPRPIYRGERLAAMPAATVLVVEGEKKADALAPLLEPLGILPVAWAGGSKAVKHTDWMPLQGRKVACWPDADAQAFPNTTTLMPAAKQPGIHAMQDVAAELERIAAGVKIVDLPPPGDLADGWDAADAVADGWDAERIMAWMKPRLRDPATPPADHAQQEQPPTHDSEHGDMQPEAPSPDEDHLPFQCLGYDHGIYYYLARGSQQVIELSGAGHTGNAMLMLAPLVHWERDFPGRKEGVNWSGAANFLMRKCERAGVFDPARARGRGAWWDDGAAVLHMGDRLVINEAEVRLTDVRSRYVYEAASPMRFSMNGALPAVEAAKLRELCAMLTFEKPIDATLLAGWCVIAPICGALAWRPHIWLTGPAGSGKSWIFENILRRCLGDTALAVQSETTEAGLRQTLGHDARPVVFDEAEGEDQRAQARIQNVMALMRQSSSENGAAILKGSATGVSKSYRIRSCFAFASIGVGVQQHADQTRVTVLTLAIDQNATRQARLDRFQALKVKWLDTLTEDYVQRLQARAIRLIPVIRHNAEVFAVAGTKVMGTRRMGDQVGALLAGAYALHSSKEISLAHALDWVEDQDWTDEAAMFEQRDELACLNHILEYTVRAKCERVTVDRTIGELVMTALRIKSDPDGIMAQECEETLHRFGIRTIQKGGRPHIVVSNNHSAMARMLSDTQWAKNWGRILKRADGAEATQPLRFGPGTMSRGVMIPASQFITEGQEPLL